MTTIHKIKKIHFNDLSKGHCQDYHRTVLEVIKEAGLGTEPELIQILSKYEEDIVAMQGVVALYRGFDITPEKKKVLHEIKTRYRYIYRVWKSFEFNQKIVSMTEYQKFEHEVLDVFPLSVLKKPVHTMIGQMSVLLTHLKNDWMPLLQKTEMTGYIEDLEKKLDMLNSAVVQKAEEASKREKRIAKRLMSDLSIDYQILVFYIEAWSNNWSQVEDIQIRREMAVHALNQCNEIIAELKHGLAVAKSNRRRAKQKSEG